MTTINDPESFGLPSEAELGKLASEYFPEFDAQTCASGIEGLAHGDTSIFNVASNKAQNSFFNNTQQAESFSTQSLLNSQSDLNATNSYDALIGEVLQETAYQNIFDVVEQQEVGNIPPTQTSNSVVTGFSPKVLSASEAESLVYTEKNKVEPNTIGGSNTRLSSIIVGTKSIEEIRADFPILQEQVNGNQLVWFDNGATTQRPKVVIDRISEYYTHENSNVHRGAHALAARSTDAYEAARQTVANFIGSPSKDNIVWVRGTTEGINLVAQAFVRPRLSPGDEIIVSLLEHHANIVPWQLVAQATGAVIKVIPIDNNGNLLISEYEKLFTKRTKFVSVAHVSNTLGTITPVDELTAIAHRHGVPILIDGAQSIAHVPVNVAASDIDFYVFSGHKVYGPNGIGAVYGKKELWEQAIPYQGGGNMIKDVTFERTIYNPAPNKFEAGTGSIADAVGLGAALDYLTEIGMANVAKYEHELTQYAVAELKKVKGLHLIGLPAQKSGVLSFAVDGYPVEAIGEYLNKFGIAIRAGHHCAQPVLRHLGYEGTARAVLGLYNTPEEVDKLVRTLYSLH